MGIDILHILLFLNRNKNIIARIVSKEWPKGVDADTDADDDDDSEG